MSGLPSNWKVVKLGDVIRLKNGYAFKSQDYAEDGVPLIRISDINDNKVTTEASVRIPKDKINPDFFIEPGDLLIAMSGATTGKTGVYSGSEPVLQNQRVGNFKIIDESVVNRKWRNYYVASLRKEIEKAAYGGAQPNISSKGIEAFDFPLAPLDQQKHIVAEIEKQFSRLDEAVANLKRVKANLKRYKAAVLKAAVEGVDRGWPETRLAEVCKIGSGFAFKSVDFRDSGIPAVKIANIGYGEFLWKDQEYLPQSFLNEYESFVVRPGDLLLALTRPITNGTVKVCRYPADAPVALLNQRVAVLHPTEKAKPEFLLSLLQSEIVKAQLIDALSETLQPNLSPVDLKKFSVRLPHVREQMLIIDEVDRCLSLAREVEYQVKANLKRAEHLRQSILSRVFAGGFQLEMEALERNMPRKAAV